MPESYTLTLSGPRPLPYQLVQDRSRIPALEVSGFGEIIPLGQKPPWGDGLDPAADLHTRLIAALRSAGLVLPHHIHVLGPGHAVVAPGLALAIFLEIVRVSGIDIGDAVGWGQITLDGQLERSIAGNYAVALAAAQDGIERMILPWPAESIVRAIPGLRVFELAMPVQALTLDACEQPPLLDPFIELSPARSNAIAQFRQHPALALAIEVAIAGRFPALLTGPDRELLDWTCYAKACTPTLTPAVARMRAAQLSLSPVTGLPSHAGAPIRQPSPEIKPEGMTATGRGPWPAAGELAQAHHGLLLLDDVGSFTATSLEPIGYALEHGSIRLPGHAGDALPIRATVIAAMPSCFCAPPRGRPCGCAPGLVARARARVLHGLRHVQIFGDAGLDQAAIPDQQPSNVRSRIARAWAEQDAQLGVGVRIGDRDFKPDNLISRVAWVLNLLDGGTCSPGQEWPGHRDQAIRLATCPW